MLENGPNFPYLAPAIGVKIGNAPEAGNDGGEGESGKLSMAKSSKPKLEDKPDPECTKLASEIAEIARWVAGNTRTKATDLDGVRAKLSRALQVLWGLPVDYEDRQALQRMHAVRLIHQTIDDIGCTDALSLLSEVNGRLYGHRPGWFMKQVNWTPAQIALAQRVLDNWKHAKWDPINDLLEIWNLRHPGKRRGGTKTSGKVHPLKQEYRDHLEKIGA